MSRFLTKILNEPPGGRPQAEIVDAHKEEPQTPIVEEIRRPQSEPIDASQKPVDAKTPTTISRVGAKTPTRRKSRRPQSKTPGVYPADRHVGDRVRQHFRVASDLDERFRLFRAKHKLELQEFYELAGVHFIECVDANKQLGVDANASLDDRGKMILFKTEPSIINLYLQYNPENRWKPADDYEGIRYNGKDIRLIEVGIIQTQFNARFKKINSFKYYTTEIDIALETPLTEETIEIMLKQGRRRWREATGRGPE